MAAFDTVNVVLGAELSLVEGVTDIAKSLVRVTNVIFCVSLFVLLLYISYISLLWKITVKLTLSGSPNKDANVNINYSNLLV